MGRVPGGGRLPYLAQAALDDSHECSCPSRKFPCKHALGLLFRYAEGAVPAGHPPDWVTGWLADRAAHGARLPRQQSGQRDEPADPQAAARRAASRDAKVDAGVQEMRH
jgi:hypothetical protein